MKRAYVYRKAARARRGLAPFEFIMLLPIWVLFMCLILHVGSAGITSIRVTNQTRYDAWKQREQKPPTDVAPMVWKHGQQQGEIKAKKNSDIRTGTYFDRWNNKFSSEQSLYTGSWNSDSVTKSQLSGSASSNMNSQQTYYSQIRGDLTRNGAPDFPRARSSAAAQNIPNK